jgi:hypothetical protein
MPLVFNSVEVHQMAARMNQQFIKSFQKAQSSEAAAAPPLLEMPYFKHAFEELKVAYSSLSPSLPPSLPTAIPSLPSLPSLPSSSSHVLSSLLSSQISPNVGPPGSPNRNGRAASRTSVGRLSMGSKSYLQ